jgi:hypothetical protein
MRNQVNITLRENTVPTLNANIRKSSAATIAPKFVRHALRTRLVKGRVSGFQKRRRPRNGNSMSRKVNFPACFTFYHWYRA